MVGADGTADAKFYLKDGQSVRIDGVSTGVSYQVSENPEDYKSEATAGTDAANGTIANKDVTVGYTNTRAGQIPTGVIMTVVPFAGVMLLGGAGAVITMRKKRDDDDEE